MAIERLRPEGLVRSPAFSHVAIVPPGSTTVYLGGQNGVDETGAIVSDDIADQSVRALQNAVVALEADQARAVLQLGYALGIGLVLAAFGQGPIIFAHQG